MRVTRLEIFGFKSFVERFVLNFDHNMIGVVGPNGCGKSNIVDALRWVLGETHAKQLRGSLFDDLIFNGSEVRRPLGMAEVSIVVRPSEGWANGHPVLTDSVQNVLGIVEDEPRLEVDEHLDVVTAAIQQESTRSAAPGDEALLHARPTILTEIPGLLDAAEIQFTRRLYRSGESEYFINRVPCRLRDMTDMYRLIGLGARGLSIVQQGEIGQFISCKPIERRELLEEAAGISGFRARMEAAQRRMEKTADNMARLYDIMSEVEKQVRVLSRQAKRAKERNELKAELRHDELELYRAKVAKIDQHRRELLRTVAKLGEECQQAASELNLSESRQGELQAKLEELEVQLSDDRRERDSLQAMLNGEQARLNELRLELAMVEGRIESAGSLLERFDEREKLAHEEITTRGANVELIRPRMEALQVKRKEAEDFLASLQAEQQENLSAMKQELVVENRVPAPLLADIEHHRQLLQNRTELGTAARQLDEQTRHQRTVLEDLRKEQSEARLALARLESEHDALGRQLQALAEHVAKAVELENPLAAEEKVLLSVIEVPKELQRAVQAVLGERGQYLVRKNAWNVGRELGNTPVSPKRIGLIEQHPPQWTISKAAIESLTQQVPSARLLCESITVQTEYRVTLNGLLGGVIVVQDLPQAAQAMEILRAAGQERAVVVTESGAVFTDWGWFTTEGEGQAYGFTRDAAALRMRIEAQHERVKELEARTAAEELRFEGLEAEQLQLAEKLRSLQATEQHLQTLLEQQRGFERETEQARREQENRIREELLTKEREAQERLRLVIGECSQVQGELGLEERRASDLRAELEGIHSERQGVQAELENLRREKHRIDVDLVRGVENSKLNVDEIRAQMGRLDEALHQVEEKRRPIRLQVAEVAELVAAARRKQQDKQEHYGRSNLALEKIELELTMLREETQRQYPDSTEPSTEELEAVLARSKGDVDGLISELQEGAARLRRRMEREGEVDPQSIELFDQEEARLRGMEEQYQDLQSATEILSRTIRQLKEISRERFVSTFKSVNEKFQVLLPRLFGGGAGYLELINPEDPLTSGVELIVRPPGKKLTNMELLSGGEKALVAVSVLMSMFLHRPSPLCVLDEVDAPLDEANLERYLNLISEISRNTQFLVITHNKRTMAEAGRLVGITMQEKGVSTALSVTLEDSGEEIDRWVANA